MSVDRGSQVGQKAERTNHSQLNCQHASKLQQQKIKYTCCVPFGELDTMRHESIGSLFFFVYTSLFAVLEHQISKCLVKIDAR